MARRTRRRGRRRGYRRNPAFSVQGIAKQFQQGFIDAAGVVGGKAATRLLANLLPIPNKQDMVINLAVQGVSAIVVGMAARQFFGAQTARMMVAGGFAAPVETLMKGIPVIGPALGDDLLQLGQPLPIGEYYMGETEQDLPIGEYVEY